MLASTRKKYIDKIYEKLNNKEWSPEYLSGIADAYRIFKEVSKDTDEYNDGYTTGYDEGRFEGYNACMNDNSAKITEADEDLYWIGFDDGFDVGYEKGCKDSWGY